MITNILLELLLKRQKFEEIEKFLRKTPRESLNISEFSLYSMGIALFRRNMNGVFLKVIDDLLINGGLGVVRLDVMDMSKISKISKRFNLDFDDAYQYVVAEKYNLIIVSLDRHFDKTDRGRRTPDDLLLESKD